MAFPLAKTGPTRFALQALLGIPLAIAMCLIVLALLFPPIATQSGAGFAMMTLWFVAAMVTSYWLKRADAPDGVYWAGLALGTSPWLALLYFGLLR